MPPLDAALPLAEMGHGSRAVTEDLHLDVPGARHDLLDVHIAVPESLERLRLAARIRVGDLLDAAHHPHATAAAARHRLDHHRAAITQRREKIFGLLERDRAR